jgi:creatinine amidohydrolase
VEIVELEKLTWTDTETKMKAGHLTVLFACGSTEQHGPHLPLCTDTVLGTDTAVRAARILGKALVAPTIRPGCSEHHMGFPGTLTLSFDTFIRVLDDYCTSLSRHGFKRIVFFSSHGGNTDLMVAHYPAIAKKLADRSLVFMALPGMAAMEKQAKFLLDRGVSRPRAGVHAGYTETAEMLVVAPELVHMDRAAPGRCDDDFYAPEQIKWSQLDSFVRGIRVQSPNGILGDATGATADVGELLMQMRAQMVVEQLKRLPAVG